MDHTDDMDLSDGKGVLVGTSQPQGNKRSLDSSDDTTTTTTKKPRIEVETSALCELPVAVLQRIFLHLPPATLLRCTRVCKHLKNVLENAKAQPAGGKTSTTALQQVASENIWTASRRATYWTLPKPMSGMSEVEMLRLITRRTCQHCQASFPTSTPTSALNGGPGTAGFRAIWQFRMALCGTCFPALTLTDAQLLQVNTELAPGSLRQALPYVLVTSDMHIIDEVTARKESTAATKTFLYAHVKDIEREYFEAKAFGTAALEGWINGLADMGRLAMTDAKRWVNWEAKLPNGTQLADHLRKLDPVSFPRIDDSKHHPQSNVSVQEPGALAHPLRRPVLANELQDDFDRDPLELQHTLRVRRDDIIHRCQELIPPLHHDILRNMAAYQAAKDISHPLTDAEWDMLRQELERDRDEAEWKHHEDARVQYEQTRRLAFLNVAATPVDAYQFVVSHDKIAERQWEDSRVGIRQGLAEYADDIINRSWLRTAHLSAATAPFFVVDVLTSVYQRHTYDHDTPLVLDDLRWVYDHKVRTAAEACCRELFACAGCFTDMQIVRWMAFEGLIQHYAAKHTDDFTDGNVVVHWQKAMWPEDPPFVTDLTRVLQQVPPRRAPKHDHRPGSKHGQHGFAARDGRSRTNVARPSDTHHNRIAETFAAQDEYRMMDIAKGKQVRHDFITDTIKEMWELLAGVDDMLDSIRVYTVLLATRRLYEATFREVLDVGTFTDVLAFETTLTSIKDASELACGFCDPTREGTAMTYYQRLANKKVYTFKNLLNHLNLAHHGSLERSHPGIWINFIDLPDKDQILALMESAGMDDSKLILIDQTFPGVFPQPLPTTGLLFTTKPKPPKSDLISRLLDNASVTSNKSKKKKGAKVNVKKDSKKEGYDPSNPAFTDKQQPAKLDLSKYDTELQRPPSIAPKGPRAPTVAPDILAAIDSLQSALQPGSRSVEGPLSPFVKPAIPTTQLATSPTMPDISAIISQLNRSGMTSPAFQDHRASAFQRDQSGVTSGRASAFQQDQYGMTSGRASAFQRDQSGMTGNRTSSYQQAQASPMQTTPPYSTSFQGNIATFNASPAPVWQRQQGGNDLIAALGRHSRVVRPADNSPAPSRVSALSYNYEHYGGRYSQQPEQFARTALVSQAPPPSSPYDTYRQGAQSDRHASIGLSPISLQYEQYGPRYAQHYDRNASMQPPSPAVQYDQLRQPYVQQAQYADRNMRYRYEDASPAYAHPETDSQAYQAQHSYASTAPSGYHVQQQQPSTAHSEYGTRPQAFYDEQGRSVGLFMRG